MSNIQPLNNYVIIRVPEREKEAVTASGLVLPETVIEEQDTGEVVAVSNDTYDLSGAHVDLAVKPGDTVVFQPWNSRPVTVNGETLHYIAYNSIVAVITE